MFFLGGTSPFAGQQGNPDIREKLIITGKVETLHKEPIAEVGIQILVNGEPQPLLTKEADEELGTSEIYAPDNEVESSSNGNYTATIYLKKGMRESADIKIRIEKPSYVTEEISISGFSELADRPGELYPL